MGVPAVDGERTVAVQAAVARVDAVQAVARKAAAAAEEAEARKQAAAAAQAAEHKAEMVRLEAAEWDNPRLRDDSDIVTGATNPDNLHGVPTWSGSDSSEAR